MVCVAARLCCSVLLLLLPLLPLLSPPPLLLLSVLCVLEQAMCVPQCCVYSKIVDFSIVSLLVLLTSCTVNGSWRWVLSSFFPFRKKHWRYESVRNVLREKTVHSSSGSPCSVHTPPKKNRRKKTYKWNVLIEKFETRKNRHFFVSVKKTTTSVVKNRT